MVYGPGVQPPFSTTGPLLSPSQTQPGSWLQRPNGTAGAGNSLPQQMPLMPPQVMLQYRRPQPPLHSSTPPYGQVQYGGSPPPGSAHAMQKLNEGGMPGEFWDQREQRFDPQFRPRQTHQQTHQRFHQQNSPPDGHSGVHIAC